MQVHAVKGDDGIYKSRPPTSVGHRQWMWVTDDQKIIYSEDIPEVHPTTRESLEIGKPIVGFLSHP